MRRPPRGTRNLPSWSTTRITASLPTEATRHLLPLASLWASYSTSLIMSTRPRLALPTYPSPPNSLATPLKALRGDRYIFKLVAYAWRLACDKKTQGQRTGRHSRGMFEVEEGHGLQPHGDAAKPPSVEECAIYHRRIGYMSCV